MRAMIRLPGWIGASWYDSCDAWVTYPKLVQIGCNKLSTLEGNYSNQPKHLAKQNCFKSEGPESACSWNLATLNNSFLCQHKYHSLFFPEGCRVFPLDNPALRFRRMVSQLSPAWAPSKLNISKSLLSPQSRPGEKFRLLGPSDSGYQINMTKKADYFGNSTWGQWPRLGQLVMVIPWYPWNGPKMFPCVLPSL